MSLHSKVELMLWIRSTIFRSEMFVCTLFLALHFSRFWVLCVFLLLMLSESFISSVTVNKTGKALSCKGLTSNSSSSVFPATKKAAESVPDKLLGPEL